MLALSLRVAQSAAESCYCGCEAVSELATHTLKSFDTFESEHTRLCAAQVDCDWFINDNGFILSAGTALKQSVEICLFM